MSRVNMILVIIGVLFAIANANIAKTVSASVSETSINGIEGLNLKFTLPFEFQDAIVGIKYSLINLKNLPDSLFFKKSIDINSDNKLSFDGEYNINKKNVDFTAIINNSKLGLIGKLVADSSLDKKLSKIGFVATRKINDSKVTFDSLYTIAKKKLEVIAKVTTDAVTTDIKFDNIDNDPILTVGYDIDEKNTIAPSVSLRNGQLSYKYNRKLDTGSIAAKFFPGDKVEVEWKDSASTGAWVTKAEIPFDNTKSAKLSVGKEWTY